MRRAFIVIIAIALSLITLAVFARLLGADFVFWDDNVSIYQNKRLGPLNLHTIKWALTDVDATMRYIPLSLLSWVVTYQLCELNPLGYHLGNLLLHCANVSLAFLVIGKLLRPRPGEQWTRIDVLAAALGALAWGLHPLRVEPVGWCTARTYNLALFFLLISVLCYLRSAAGVPSLTRGPRRMWYWCAIAAYAASLFSHPVGLGLVGALIVMDVYPLGRIRLRHGLWPDRASWPALWSKLPFVVVVIIALTMTLWARFHTSQLYEYAAPPNLDQFSILHRLLQAMYLWCYYAWRPWWPIDMAPVYTTLLHISGRDSRFTTSAATVVILTLVFLRRWQDWPLLLALWICHLVLLVPALGLTEHPHYPTDRYSLLPGLIWAIALAVAIKFVWDRSDKKALPWACTVTASTVVIALASLTVRQTGYWRNSVTLFNHMLVVLGDDPYRSDIYGRLGLVLANQSPPDWAAAEKAFADGMKANPKDLRLRGLLSEVWCKQGRLNSAVLLLREGLEIDNTLLPMHWRLAEILTQAKRYPEAIGKYQEIRRRFPEEKRVDDAIKNVERLAREQAGESR